MTCRFELEFKGEQYPRSCPTCGLSGNCVKGYGQLRKPGGGYVIVDPSGNYPAGNGVQGPIGELQANSDPFIPATRPHGEAAFMAEKLTRVIETRRRLGLIGYLTTLTKLDSKTVQELDNIVDDIAAILLD